MIVFLDRSRFPKNRPERGGLFLPRLHEPSSSQDESETHCRFVQDQIHDHRPSGHGRRKTHFARANAQLVLSQICQHLQTVFQCFAG